MDRIGSSTKGDLMTYRKQETPLLKGISKTNDYTLTIHDYAIGVDTSSNDVTITVPTASGVVDYPRRWFIKKMTANNNYLYIALQTPGDSMYGASFSSIAIQRQGEGVEIILNANQKYTFSDWSGIENPLASPSVTTQTPTLSSTTLTMNGSVESLGSFSSVDAYFRYRDVTAGATTWTETTKVSKNTLGSYSDTATVTAGNVFEVQAVVDDSNGNSYYGAVLRNSVNYYSDTTEASNDGLERYWPMQETSGTDTTATETMATDNMTMYNGVTIGSDTINGNVIYKRIFGSSDYGQAGYQPNWTWSGGSKTILIQVDHNSNSGDHTILNFGRNILSMASDGTGIQLEVNNRISTWSSATPFTSILNVFITVDRSAWKTSLFTCTSSTRTLRTSQWEIPDNQASYTRLGRGSSGDANHQDFEYMDNGEVRSIAVWGRVLSQNEMTDICTILDTDGGLIV